MNSKRMSVFVTSSRDLLSVLQVIDFLFLSIASLGFVRWASSSFERTPAPLSAPTVLGLDQVGSLAAIVRVSLHLPCSRRAGRSIRGFLVQTINPRTHGLVDQLLLDPVSPIAISACLPVLAVCSSITGSLHFSCDTRARVSKKENGGGSL